MFLCRSMCFLLSGWLSLAIRLLQRSIVLAVVLLAFSVSVSDARVVCCSPSRLRMRYAVCCPGLCTRPTHGTHTPHTPHRLHTHHALSTHLIYTIHHIHTTPHPLITHIHPPRSVYSPHARYTHIPHTPHRLHTHHTLPHTSYTPYTASTPHHVHSSHTFIHHPSPMLAHTQIWDGMLLVTYLGYTSVFDQIQQTYPMPYNALRCLTKFNQSIQPS